MKCYKQEITIVLEELMTNHTFLWRNINAIRAIMHIMRVQFFCKYLGKRFSLLPFQVRIYCLKAINEMVTGFHGYGIFHTSPAINALNFIKSDLNYTIQSSLYLGTNSATLHGYSQEKAVCLCSSPWRGSFPAEELAILPGTFRFPFACPLRTVLFVKVLI